MAVFLGEIKKLAKRNKDFRRELATNAHSQLVLMCLEPDEDIGEEVHEDVDQVFVVVRGKGEAVLDGVRKPLRKGALLIVPAGTRHNLVNVGDQRLRLYTLYAPPQHPPGTVHATRAEAMAAEAEHAATTDV